MDPKAYDEMRALEDHHWWFRGRRRVARKLVGEALDARPGARLLEVGCGTGGNLVWIERAWPGVRTAGLDLDRRALAHSAARGLRAALLAADGLRLPMADGSVDVLLAFDVIEHFEDEARLLDEFVRVLAPGGVLLASVPAYPALWSPHDDFLHHKRRYRTGELEGRLEERGLVLERRHGFNFLLLGPIALARAIKSATQGKAPPASDFFRLPAAANAALGLLFAVEAALVAWLPIRFGLSFLLRAARPRAQGGRSG